MSVPLYIPLIVLRPPSRGPLAVLWWAAILAFFILAAYYAIRARSMARSGNRVGKPSSVTLWVLFLLVVALVAVVLFAIHIVPGT
jgi:hypothetical protein